MRIFPPKRWLNILKLLEALLFLLAQAGPSGCARAGATFTSRAARWPRRALRRRATRPPLEHSQLPVLLTDEPRRRACCSAFARALTATQSPHRRASTLQATRPSRGPSRTRAGRARVRGPARSVFAALHGFIFDPFFLQGLQLLTTKLCAFFLPP